MRTTFNDDEYSALEGLPLAARVLYMCAIRPYMDYMTGFVGIKRGISLQSLKECLYVEPHSGVKRTDYSQQQVRRIVEWLVDAGLLERRSVERKSLIFFLPLADTAKSVQKKPDTNPTLTRHSKTDTMKSSNGAVYREQADTNPTLYEVPQPDTPTRVHEYTINTSTNVDVVETPKKTNGIPYKEIEKLYHECLPMLSGIYKWNEKRERQVKALWHSELKDLAHWKNYFTYIARSKFLTGRAQGKDGRAWRADFDFIINETNFIKIAEGKYDEQI